MRYVKAARSAHVRAPFWTAEAAVERAGYDREIPVQEPGVQEPCGLNGIHAGCTSATRKDGGWEFETD